MFYQTLSNPNVWAIACEVTGDKIDVGILAVRYHNIRGTVQTLYSQALEPYTVQIPLNPQIYRETLWQTSYPSISPAS